MNDTTHQSGGTTDTDAARIAAHIAGHLTAVTKGTKTDRLVRVIEQFDSMDEKTAEAHEVIAFITSRYGPTAATSTGRGKRAS